MENTVKNLRWGFIEIIMVYVGILLVGLLFGIFGDGIMAYLAEFAGIPDNELSYFTVASVIQFVATVGLVFLFALGFGRGSWRDLGLKSARAGEYAKYGLAGGFLLVIVITGLGVLISRFQPDLQPQVFETMLRSISGYSGFVLLLLIGAVLAPLSEELFYRGMMYPVFRKYVGPAWGAVLAGAVFGFSHWDLWRAIPLTLGGAALCYIYEKTGSIWVSTVAHGLWNGIMSVIVYFSIIKIS